MLPCNRRMSSAFRAQHAAVDCRGRQSDGAVRSPLRALLLMQGLLLTEQRCQAQDQPQSSLPARCRAPPHTSRAGGRWPYAARNCEGAGRAGGLEERRRRRPVVQACRSRQHAISRQRAEGATHPSHHSPRPANQAVQSLLSTHMRKAWPAGQSAIWGWRAKRSCCASSRPASGTGSRRPVERGWAHGTADIA